MGNLVPPPAPAGSAVSRQRGPRRVPQVVYGGILLTITGVLSILEGVASLNKNDVFSRFHQYVYKLDLTGWGWIHIGLGTVGILCGAAVTMTAAKWARILGILLASAGILVNFLFSVYQLLWSLTLIGFCVFVIWSLSTYNEYENM